MDFFWCKNRRRKLANRGKGSTPGRQKGLSCQATALERWMANHNRSYKHPLYNNWLLKKNGEKH